MGQPTTEDWAGSHGIATIPTLAEIEGYDEPSPRTGRQIAARAVIVHGIVAVACEVDRRPIVSWFRDQNFWDLVSPREQEFLESDSPPSREVRNALRWRQEAEWALFWAVGKVETLGLPTTQCDTRRLADEIMPALGSELEPFLASARLRSPGSLLAEDDRHYQLWCRYLATRRQGAHLLPRDLEVNVLHQRRHAFEWMCGSEGWDDVRCDA